MSKALTGLLPGGLTVVAALLAGGCFELDLGSSPFYCNNGTPLCPSGYDCVQVGGQRVCVREGTKLPQLDGLFTQVDGKGGSKDQGKEGVTTPDSGQPDMSVADYWPTSPDQYVKPDLPPPPDQGAKPDVPKLGCQNNAECKKKDSQNPCCCKIAIIWVCAPLCLDPFCLPI